MQKLLGINAVAFWKVKVQSFGAFMSFDDRFPFYIHAFIFIMIIYIHRYAYPPIFPCEYMCIHCVHITRCFDTYSEVYTLFCELHKLSKVLYDSLSSIFKIARLCSTLKSPPLHHQSALFLKHE